METDAQMIQILEWSDKDFILFFLNFYLFMIAREREREREAETQAEGEAGSMHREPDVGFDPGSLLYSSHLC